MLTRAASAAQLGSFEPAPIPRPKSALNLHVRKELGRIKGLANSVSSSAAGERHGSGALILEDLTSKQLMLSHDTELQVERTMVAREREMRDIVDGRQRKYNQRRLLSDKKEDALTKMVLELEALESFKTKMERASKVEDIEARRLAEVREELIHADRAMEEAVGYTASLEMMRARLVTDITKRRKLQYELDKHLAEARREANVALTHQRTLLAAETDALERRDKLDAHLVSRRGVQTQQLAQRRAVCESLAQGGGPGGRDVVAEHAAAVAARQKRMAAAQAQQTAIRWTLDTVNQNVGRMHAAGTMDNAAGAPAAPAAPAHRAPPRQGRAPPVLARRTSSVAGRVVNMPSKVPDEIKSLTGAVAAEDVKRAKEGPFARYMQRIYAETGVTDGTYVLRRLHHWARTEKTVQAQTAAATARHEALRREEQEVSAQLNHLRGKVLLESDKGAADAASGGARHVDDFLESISVATKRLTHAEMQCDGRTRLLLDATTALNNLLDRLKSGVPELVREAKAAVSVAERASQAARRYGASEGNGDDDEEDESDHESVGAEGDGAESVASGLDTGGAPRSPDGIRGELGVVVPRKVETCEMVYEKVLFLLGSKGVAVGATVDDSVLAPQSPAWKLRSQPQEQQQEQQQSREQDLEVPSPATRNRPSTAQPSATEASMLGHDALRRRALH